MRETFSGLPASPGIGIGLPHVIRPAQISPNTIAAQEPPSTEQNSPETQAEQEWQRFLHAHAQADAELEQLIDTSNPLIADIFSSQRLILHDSTLLEAVRSAIHEQAMDAVAATRHFIAEMEAVFQCMEDEYFASRAVDITDVGNKIIAQLQNPASTKADQSAFGIIEPDTIVIAHSLTPSELFALPRDNVRAVALVEGAPTAHVAILARTLEIPLMCALDSSALDAAEAAQQAIVDGNTGQLLLQPTPEDLEHYSNSRIYLSQQKAAAAQDAHLPALTIDGHYIPICANVNGIHEVLQAFEHGADGIGLLRTEFLYLGSTTPPPADQQQQTLTDIAELCQRHLDQRALGETQGKGDAEAPTEDEPRPLPQHMHRRRVHSAKQSHRLNGSMGPPLTIRLLDAGGDKPLAFMQREVEEANPFLGLRGLRLLLHQPELLQAQLQAVVRTALAGPFRLRLMVPMVTTLNELRTIRTMLQQVIESESAAHGVEPEIQLGVLVEVPALALMADDVAPEVDFLSIGTNDLTQYVLAADRANSMVASLADPLHPSLLQLIRQTCRAGHKAGISISVCGEIASDPTATPLLIGLGVTELSANPPAIPLVKQAVRHCDLLRCRELAEQALHCTSSEAVRKLLTTTQVMQQLYPPTAAVEPTPISPDDSESLR